MTGPQDRCESPAGSLLPVVNRSKCEGKADCARVCPYQVFEIRTLTGAQKAELPLIARLRALAHANRQAFAVRAGDCHACGLCVSSCPEAAITLTRRPAAPAAGG